VRAPARPHSQEHKHALLEHRQRPHRSIDAHKLDLARELDLLRQELTEIRRAYMALRALLVAGTVVGAGYNTTPTNLGDAAATAAATSPRFTPT